MKFFLSLLITFFISTFYSQDKVEWRANFNKATGSVEIIADIAKGWHLYSQHINKEIGPIPTKIIFKENRNVVLVGRVEEPIPIKEHDENFEATLEFFKEKVIFTQKIDLKFSTTQEITVSYMVCSETMCLPPVDKNLVVELIIN